MIDPNERYVDIDKNWNKNKSWMDPDSDYWKKNRNNNTDNCLHTMPLKLKINEYGREVREITPAELAKLKAP